MSIDTKENDLLDTVIATETNPLHALQKEIANMPAIDTDKVARVIKKLENGELSILGSAKEQQECATRIAKLIIAESNED